MGTIIKALTVSQPYASLIATGEKFAENRTWVTAYRGLCAIHAGKGTQYLPKKEIERRRLPMGCIIAIGEIQACLDMRQIFQDRIPKTLAQACTGSFNASWLTRGSLRTHRHAEGPQCFIFGDVIMLEEPIVITGQRLLWDWKAPTRLLDWYRAEVDAQSITQPMERE